MKKDYRKLEQTLMEKESIKKVLQAVKSEEPQMSASFAADLEAKLLSNFVPAKEPAEQTDKPSVFETLINLFQRRSFAYVSAFVILIFLTYVVVPFPQKFSANTFLNQAYAHYEQEQEIIRSHGDIHYTKIIGQNGPDLAKYVQETAYGNLEELPAGYELALEAMKEGGNQIITETWRDDSGNYFSTSKYAETGLSFGSYLQTANGDRYTSDERISILQEYQEYGITLYTCIDTDGDSLDFSSEDIPTLIQDGSLSVVDGKLEITNESNPFDLSSEDQEYYQEFGNLYGGESQNRGSILESLQERENVNYVGSEKIDGVKHRVFSFDQPLPDDITNSGFGADFGSITWLYFTDDYELTRQDTGIRLNGQEYRLQTVIFSEEDYVSDETIFLPETHRLNKVFTEEGCYDLMTGVKEDLTGL